MADIQITEHQVDHTKAGRTTGKVLHLQFDVQLAYI